MLIEEKDSPWPRKGDHLFVEVIRKMSNFFEAVSWQLSVTLEREQGNGAKVEH